MKSANSNDVISQDDHWKNLALMAQKGDKRAYSTLLKEIFPYIKMSVTTSLANPDWIDDVAQDVLISVHKSLESYSTDRPFKPWLRAIINFRKADFLRSHYRQKNVQDKALESSEVFSGESVTKPSHAGELKDIESALHTLSEKQRTIFQMIKIEGYSAKEVAKEMDMSVSAVKVSAHRTANKLKEILDEDE